jgi:hypothetical protein
VSPADGQASNGDGEGADALSHCDAESDVWDSDASGLALAASPRRLQGSLPPA